MSSDPLGAEEGDAAAAAGAEALMLDRSGSPMAGISGWSSSAAAGLKAESSIFCSLPLDEHTELPLLGASSICRSISLALGNGGRFIILLRCMYYLSIGAIRSNTREAAACVCELCNHRAAAERTTWS